MWPDPFTSGGMRGVTGMQTGSGTELGWITVRQGVSGDGVPHGEPNVAKLAWVHFTRHCQFAYSRYTSV